MDSIFTGTNNCQPLRATHPPRNTAVQTAQAWRRAETGDHSWWKGLVDASDRCFWNFSKVECSYWQLPPKIVERLRTGSMFRYGIVGLNRSIFFRGFYRPRTSGFRPISWMKSPTRMVSPQVEMDAHGSCITISIVYNWLVVEPPLWKILLVSWDYYPQYMGKNKCSKLPTR